MLRLWMVALQLPRDVPMGEDWKFRSLRSGALMNPDISLTVRSALLFKDNI